MKPSPSIVIAALAALVVGQGYSLLDAYPAKVA
jgi:hypothetical protein